MGDVRRGPLDIERTPRFNRTSPTAVRPCHRFEANCFFASGKIQRLARAASRSCSAFLQHENVSSGWSLARLRLRHFPLGLFAVSTVGFSLKIHGRRTETSEDLHARCKSFHLWNLICPRRPPSMGDVSSILLESHEPRVSSCRIG